MVGASWLGRVLPAIVVCGRVLPAIVVCGRVLPAIVVCGRVLPAIVVGVQAWILKAPVCAGLDPQGDL